MADVVSLAAELITIQSTTGNEAAVVDFVSRWLVARGWNVTLQEVTRGRANIWGSRSGSEDGLTLSTHLDTVPPFVPPPPAVDLLNGRGAFVPNGVTVSTRVTEDMGTIKDGTKANIIHGLHEAELMFRLVGDVEQIKQMVVDWERGHADVEFGSHIPAQKFATVPGFDTCPVAYTSDIPLLSNWGEPLLFGPGSIHVAHTPDEYIDVEELRTSVDKYAQLTKLLLAR